MFVTSGPWSTISFHVRARVVATKTESTTRMTRWLVRSANFCPIFEGFSRTCPATHDDDSDDSDDDGDDDNDDDNDNDNSV